MDKLLTPRQNGASNRTCALRAYPTNSAPALPGHGLFRPVLVDLHRAMEATTLTRYHLLLAVEKGLLPWVWDIRCGETKQMLRFWLGALLGGKVDSEEQALARIVGEFAPPLLNHSTVENILLVDRKHVDHLNRAGFLRSVGRQITKDSILEFLKERRVA